MRLLPGKMSIIEACVESKPADHPSRKVRGHLEAYPLASNLSNKYCINITPKCDDLRTKAKSTLANYLLVYRHA
jgi:hypothetical protein